MGLEVVTFISDLVITNPGGATDPKSQGDDHLRNIKKALRNTFSGFVGAAVTLTEAQLNDAALKSAGNTFTASLGIVMSNGSPAYALNETDAGTNEKNWRMRMGAGTWSLTTYDDANALGNTAISVSRTGTTVGAIALTGTSITLNGVAASDYARLSQSNTFTGGTQTISASIARMAVASTGANNAVTRYDTNSTIRGYIGFDHSAGVITGSATGDLVARAESGGFLFSGNAGSTKHFALSAAGALTTPNATADEVGYKGLPQNAQGTYTLALTDAGKSILATGNISIPTDASVAFPVGTTIMVINNTVSTLTVAAVTPGTTTLRWSGTGGTDGSRTLASHQGVCTLHKPAANFWLINGDIS